MPITIQCRKESGSETVRFRKGGKKHYSIEIFLESDSPEEMSNIKAVEYELHPTFKERYRYTSDSSSGFKIVIRTYGFFNIKAKITKSDGTTKTVSGKVNF